MAFTGVPVLTKVSDKCFRVSGAITLAVGASGTIGFSDKTVAAEVSLPAPDWQPKSLDGGSIPVSLISAIQVVVNSVDAGVATAVPVRVVKTGTTHADFVITLTNNDGAAATPTLEIYVDFMAS